MMRWSDVDLDRGIWSKRPETTKTRKRHNVPLSGAAVAVLRQRLAERGERGSCRSVRTAIRVSGRRRRGHLNRVERHWHEIRLAAGLEDLRLHDLRHVYASILVNEGLSLPLIGSLLGHASATMTERYSHMSDAAQRQAVEMSDAAQRQAVELAARIVTARPPQSEPLPTAGYLR